MVNTPADFEVGSTVFERYHILGLIASGAQGRVYLTLDKLLNINIALKVQAPGAMTERDLLRFQTEAKLSSKLKHKNIATVKDFGFHNQIPYLSMEYIEGAPLDSILRDQTVVDGAMFYDVFIQVCSALQHAHANGVIHRDVKPGNIMLSNSANEELLVKVLDFGVARRTTSDTGDAKLTAAGAIVGTPLYMSPEQAQGLEVTPSSDVYSLGCVMWHCLTGAPPFTGSNSMETIMAHIDGAVPEFRAKTAGSAREALEACLKNMLAKNPNERPQLSEVETLLAGILQQLHYEQFESGVTKPPEHEPENISYQSGKRQVNKSILIGAAIAGSIVFTILLLIQRATENDTRPEPKRAYTSDQQPLLSNSAPVKVDISNRIAENGKSFTVKAIASDKSLSALVGQKGLEKIDVSDSADVTDECFKFLKNIPNVQNLSLSRTSVKTLNQLGESKNLIRLELKADAITDRSLENLLPLKKLEILKLSHCSGITDNGIATVARIKSITELNLEKIQSLTPNIAKYIVTMPKLQKLTMYETRMNTNFARKVAAMPSIENIDLRECPLFSKQDELVVAREFPLVSFNMQPSVASQIEQQGLQAETRKDYANALLAYNTVLKFVKKPSNNRFRWLGMLYTRAGTCAGFSKKYAEADQLFSKAILYAERCHDDATAYSALTTKFQFASLSGKRKSAIAELRDEALLREKRNKPSVELGMLLEVVGRLYYSERDYKEVLKWLEKAEKIYAAVDGENTPLACDAMVLEGDTLRALKNDDAALERYEQALSRLKNPSLDQEKVKKTTLTRAIALTGIGLVYQHREETERALKYANEAIVILDGIDSPAHSRAAAYRLKSKLLRKLERTEEADEFEKRSKEVWKEVPKAP